MAHPLVDCWSVAHRDFRDAVEQAPWHHGTLLPGWTVGDIVAHTVWIERTALGLPDPPHEPDFSTLPHAASAFGRATEVPVDLRRSWPRDRVLAELDEAVAQRRTLLQATEPEASLRDLFGVVRPLADVLRDRIFDLWVHEQDIRVACGNPGHLDTEPAAVAADVLLAGLGYIWAKRADAPVGATLQLTTTPPGIERLAVVERQQDGRARPVAAGPRPTVALTMPFPQFVAHACGRRNADPAAVRIDGDEGLGLAVVRGFAITP